MERANKHSNHCYCCPRAFSGYNTKNIKVVVYSILTSADQLVVNRPGLPDPMVTEFIDVSESGFDFRKTQQRDDQFQRSLENLKRQLRDYIQSTIFSVFIEYRFY